MDQLLYNILSNVDGSDADAVALQVDIQHNISRVAHAAEPIELFLAAPFPDAVSVGARDEDVEAEAILHFDGVDAESVVLQADDAR